MPIRDNRLQLTDAEAIAPGGFPGEWVDETGGTMGLALDTATFVEGSGSMADRLSGARGGFLWQEDADRDWSSSVFYIWFNSGAANKLNTKALGGVTVRFTGATVTDWFEVFIEGADTYGGGFKMAVVDIDAARALAVGSPNAGLGATNGTPPATTAIRRVGIVFDVIGSAPGGSDNHWVDAIWRLPAGTPGVVVSGTNIDVSPIRPYNWDDIVLAGDNADPTKAWGVISKADGVIKLNTPIQFGNSGSPDDGDHDFEDALQVIAFESQIVPDNFYGFTFVGDGVNTQRAVAGVNGSAGQGWTVLAASDGPRWFLDATDVNLENVGLYGCSFTHTTAIDIDNIFVDMYDTLLIDGQRLWHSRTASPRSGADFQRNAIIAADPVTFDESPVIGSPANVAYCWTADPDKLIDNTWSYFTGHALNITEAATYSFVGNVFDSLWADGTSPDGTQTLEAALLSFADGVTTLDISGGGNTPTTFAEHVTALVLFDDFERASLGATDWDTPLKDSIWYSDAVIYNSSDFGSSSFNTEGVAIMTGVVGDKQFAEATISAYDQDYSSVKHYIYLRMSSGSPEDTGYSFRINNEFSFSSPERLNARIWKYSGSHSNASIALGNVDNFGLIKVGDVMRFEADGDTLTGYVNGQQVVQTTDASFPSGQPGIGVRYNSFGSTSPETEDNMFESATLGNLGSSFILNNNISVTLTDIQPGTEVRVYPEESPINITEIAGIESVGSPTEFTFSGAAGLAVRIVVLHLDYVLPPANEFSLTIPNSDSSFPISQVIDRNYLNP